MTTCILGPLLAEETQFYQMNNSAYFSKHSELRYHRFKLITDNEPLYHFEVYRFTDKSKQVHSLLKDGSLLIFNKQNKKIITVILPYLDLLNKYLEKTENIDDYIIRKLQKISKLNELYKVNDKKLSKEDENIYILKKQKILNC